MAITIKTQEDIEILREGGKRLSDILGELVSLAQAGVYTKEIDDLAYKLITSGGDTPSFLDYQPDFSMRPYPASVCVSINEEIVHGIPNENNRELKDGDVVSIDLGLIHRGLFTDSARTIGIGTMSEDAQRLLDGNKEALVAGIHAARGGNRVGDIGYAIEQVMKKYKLSSFKELAGHGVGYAVHEDPYVPNYGKPGTGELLRPGMVIAIEPMFTLGNGRMKEAQDGYTYYTADKTLAAHFEHTVLITEGEPEILTK